MTKKEVKLKNGKVVKVGHKVAEVLQGKKLGKILKDEPKPKAKPKAK